MGRAPGGLPQGVGSCSGSADIADMAKKPEPPKPTTWTIYKTAAKQERLGTVEAPDEATGRCRVQGRRQEADGDTAMTRRRHGPSPRRLASVGRASIGD
jgi:hypothetical protein